MTSIKKIKIEPVTEGFTKIDGESVEDVIKTLQEKGIERLLCYPGSTFDFRNHVIILTQADYNALMKEGDWEFRVSPFISKAGLYADARYKPIDYTCVKESWIIREGYAIEQTQLRPCSPEIAPEDSKFLIVNKIRLGDAMNPKKDR